jgi:ABC-type nitrate/sulfonate/bicarbonate transport system substrate-binding protein
MSQVMPKDDNDSRGPSPIALGISALALLAFGFYLWTTFAPKHTDLVIAFPHKSVLFASHIGMVLKNTDILAQNGIRARFEAPDDLDAFGKLAEHADVVLTGEAHGLRLSTRPTGARIVATLGSGGRLGLVVPEDSEITTLADLQGKRIAATPANALHRWLLGELTEAGVSASDWELTPFDGPEGELTKQADAAAQWDPFLYGFETQDGFRVLTRGEYYTSVVFGTHLLGEDRELGLAALTAIKQAFHHFNTNPRMVAQWLAGSSGKPPLPLQRACFPINPNFGRRNMNGLVLSPDLPSLVRALEQDNAFLVEQGFIDAPLDLDTIIDGTLMDEADRSALPLSEVGDAPKD